ncbi:DoxX family membrane protein [Halosquirtibacter xylanolyticus]|uniref:TQO small subunit DoxD n=1 Tax=Halosquirtibacter xylanolyticus TaxID=3374599 RepID=UPI003749A6ED|nr:DoxX family membrane protein [Prolixibacteraceae bacterium]
MENNRNTSIYQSIPLILRVVMGWIYFSAFWRRVILMNKLNPDLPGYVGEKFNAFLPNALFIKPIIQWMVENPDMLYLAMIIFTITEALIGIAFFLGIFTRLAALGSIGLAAGILLGSGWIGTTCLDEWQIGVLCMTTGFVLLFTGAGNYSLDHYLSKTNSPLCKLPLAPFIMGYDFPSSMSTKLSKRIILWSAVFMGIVMLGTNQHFHGGVWGDLHNLSKNPNYIIQNASRNNNEISFDIMRDQGIDTYGSYIFSITLYKEGKKIRTWEDKKLANAVKIKNHYIAKIKTGPHGLILPLGAKATIGIENIEDDFDQIIIEDINGKTWILNFHN